MVLAIALLRLRGTISRSHSESTGSDALPNILATGLRDVYRILVVAGMGAPARTLGLLMHNRICTCSGGSLRVS